MDGKIIFVTVVVLALVVGGVIGFYLNNNSNEISDLRQENEGLKDQVGNLQNQIWGAENDGLGACAGGLRAQYDGESLDERRIVVEFNVGFRRNGLSEEEINAFSEEYELELLSKASTGWTASFNIKEGLDLFETMCVLKADSRVKEIGPGVLGYYG